MTKGYRSFIVVNPRSAGGSTARQWPDIEKSLRDSLGDFSFGFTDGPGSATKLAAKALRAGYEMVVAIGGDGTLNEVVNGFFDSRGQPIKKGAVIGTIARGTGKDFIKTAHIPRDIEAATRALAGRAVRPWDVGKLTLRLPGGKKRIQYFLNEADFGVGGDISKRVNGSSKRLGGFFSFFWATVTTLLHYRPRRVRLKLDGKDLGEMHAYNVIVAIGRYCGGGMLLAPTAEPDDGLLDVVVIPSLSVAETVRNFKRMYDGTLLDYDRISHYRGRILEASSDELVRIGVDGESEHVLPARFEILKRAVRVKVP